MNILIQIFLDNLNIIGKKTIKKIVHYQVKWSDGDTTWEPRAKVKKDLSEILKEYEKQQLYI